MKFIKIGLMFGLFSIGFNVFAQDNVRNLSNSLKVSANVQKGCSFTTPSEYDFGVLPESYFTETKSAVYDLGVEMVCSKGTVVSIYSNDNISWRPEVSNSIALPLNHSEGKGHPLALVVLHPYANGYASNFVNDSKTYHYVREGFNVIATGSVQNPNINLFLWPYSNLYVSKPAPGNYSGNLNLSYVF